jgi:hypothetical protein
LQIIEAKEAGATGVLGVVCQVSGKGTPILSHFAGALGLDAPVEAVNQIELDFLLDKQTPIVALACSITLSFTVPGFGKDVAAGLLPAVPPSCATIVGAEDILAARAAAEGGASAVLLKESVFQDCCDDLLSLRQLVADIRYQVSGDD